MNPLVGCESFTLRRQTSCKAFLLFLLRAVIYDKTNSLVGLLVFCSFFYGERVSKRENDLF